jgi:hypothetical protein
MAAIKSPSPDSPFLQGQALVSNSALNDLVELAEENNSPIAVEIESYASLGVPVIVPIATLVRWQHFASGK